MRTFAPRDGSAVEELHFAARRARTVEVSSNPLQGQ